MPRRPSVAFVVLTTVLLLPLPGGRAGEVLDPSKARAKEGDPTRWYDLRLLDVEGKGWTDTKAFYDRLPARAEGKVRPPVWGLSRHSAGLCARFVTDAPTIQAHWVLTSGNLAMPHMPATGVSGLDLYVRTDAGRWHWLGVGQPHARDNTATLAGGLPPGRREYLLYLPLYNGVSLVEIGIPRASTLSKAPPRPEGARRPVVFYGTSITQGGCASRPGMVHTAILGRRLGCPIINLGFSGNGTMDAEIAALMGELDAAVYVIDCLPNMTGPQVAERAGPFVQALRKARPHTPILLVEDRTYTAAFLEPALRQHNRDNRAALKAAYERLQKEGV